MQPDLVPYTQLGRLEQDKDTVFSVGGKETDMPGGKNVGKNIKEIKAADSHRPRAKRRPQKQVIAIALDEARRAGVKIPKKGKK